ncbi:hypothetical protein [Pseudomonas brassicacearum]|uniref:hypothetical protein n=1 Tax=Pseudomonas brassicacearum TaxID=930166 RepID=UPI001DFC3214|nr:hypothetical protein [Pseudomonas brassicacearum]CAH0205032.1 hypothetical protein SRABI06_02011 [Pseudomonas brassicacearum]
MTYKSLGLAALLTMSAVTLAGCEQAEKSAQQLMGQATQTAKQAIDDTHKAAEQAISEATGGLISPKKKPADEADETQTPTKTI